MKTFFAILVALCVSTPWTDAQTASSPLPTANRTGQPAPADTPFAVVDRGANHRVWQRTTYETTPDGRQIPHIHEYTELATGLHYWKDGEWVESKEQIDILPDGTAAAIQGQHQAYFPGNIYQGVIEVVTPDGAHLRSRPIGLSYDDGNNTVLIAELKDSVGQIIGSNQVIYPDAFTDIKADLRYTYTKAGFEQDIVLHEQPPSPKTYRLNPQTARLQVLTEFFDTPGPIKTPTVASRQNGLNDTALGFGTMKMMRGKAFSVSDQAQAHARAKGIPVAKSWQHLSGRTFLVEELPVSKIKPQLDQLPLRVDAGTTLNLPNSLRHKVSATRLLPSVRLVQAGTNTVQLAKADLDQKPGVVLDYIQINSGPTDFTFQSATTYFVAGEMNFSGTTTFKGGSVIKVAVGWDSAVDIDENGTVVCPTNPAQPAVFTSMNDDSVGETIDGSSGGPIYSDVGGFLTLNCPDPVLRNLCFKYGYHCVLDWYFYGGNNRNLNIWDCQFMNVVIAVEVDNCNVGLHNVLITEVGDDKPIYIDDSGDLVAENVTVDGYHNLGGGDEGNYKTNCLFSESWWNGSSYDYYVSVDGNGRPVSQTQTFFLPPENYYLAPNSPYRDIGTTNINPDLLAELRQMTTYPPHGGNWPDTNALDLGYHYPLADSDYHGPPDTVWWLLQYFGHWQDVDGHADPDGDGLSTSYEYGHGATDPTTFDFTRLGHWCFDNTNTWVGDDGQLPLAASNIVGVVSWNTNAVRMDSANPAILTYRDVEIASGKANIILHDGTVRFWFKPDWSSTNIGGTGPGGYGRLIEMGHYSPTPTDGWWALYFSPDGNHLMFASATNGIIMTNLTAAISLVSNQWYLVNFAYTHYLTTLVINSQTNNGTGITCFPNATVRAQGLHIGSDASGLNQARGTFEDLETFNYYSLTMDCLPPIAPSQYIPPWLGLVGWWRAESNVVDSANSHYGVAEHISYVPGHVGTAFHFDPTINVPRVKVPDRPDFQLTNALSISAWVRPRGDGYSILYRGDSHRGLDPYSLSMQGNHSLQFSIQDEATNVASISTVIAYDQWWYVTATFDGDSGTMKLYVNGTLVNQTNTTIKPLQVLNPSLDPAIGIGNVGEDRNNFPFVGDIDEVMLYARALSPDEINAIYSAGASQIPRCGWTTNGPPYLSYVHLLKLPANNGTYAIPYSTLLTNSDAYDPQGYPLVFKVDSVATGSLMINGAPFGPENCTINSAAAVVWTPPAMMVAPGTPAFRVYVFDGIYRSVNTVDVVIKQHPKTHLFGWGYNSYGEVGNGLLADPASDPAESTFDPLMWQSAQNLIPRDPRWQYYPTNFINMSTNWYEYTPRQILDADNIISVSADESGVWRITCGISADGKLYQWGTDYYFLFGKCLAANTTNYSTLGSTTFWEWGSGPPSEALYPVGLRVPSPRLYQMPFPNGDYQPFNNIKTVVNGGLFEIALKNDGTLWSWGQASWVNTSLNNAFGRHPQDDLFPGEPGSFGMSPRRIEFEGNNNSGVIDGRQVVEIKVDNYAPGISPTAIARCQDGTLWWWGIMGQWFDSWNFWDVDITGEEASHPIFDPMVPTRLTNFDSPAGVPDTSFIQMDIKGNHLVVLKQDGSVWELGYIPHLDNGGAEQEDIMNSYSRVPLQVTGLPQNVVSICSGIRFGVAVTADGSVWIWGFAPDANETAPRQIRSFKNITKVVSTGYVWWTDASWQQLLALDKNGSVWGWWHDLNDYINFNNTIQTNAFRIPGLENVTDIFCGLGNNFAIGTEEQGKPTNLKATSLNQGVQLSWTNYPGANYYIVYRSLNEENGYAAIGTATVNSYLDQNPPLQNGVTYYYEVSAVINGVETAQSWWAAATPQPVPSPVVNLVAVNECRAVKLLWSAPANAALSNPQEYRIERLSPFDVAFVPVAHCQPGATSYEDDLIVAGQTCYYRVIPVNSAGSPATNICAIVHGSLDAGSCAPCPTISANWWQGPWFDVGAPTPSEFGFNSTATLCWTGPQTGSWGAGLTGFRIHWRIEYQYNNKTYTFGPFSRDVSLTDVAANVPRTMPNGDSVMCYQSSWQSFGDYGTKWWASVSAIVNGQESLPSIEVGPRSASTGTLVWNVTPRAVPGYQQVYLDWQDDDAICQYAVECSTLPPSIGFVLGDWVTLADGLTEPRYWDVGFAATNFAPVDIKYLFREDRPPNLIGRLRADPASKDPVSTIVWGLLSSSATNMLANANANDATSVRQLLASEFNRIMHSGSVIFTTNEVGMTDADLSTQTRNLLGRLNNTNPPLSSDELVHLNRLLLEDAYVHEIARIDEPAPAEFVSGEVHDIYHLVLHLLSSDPGPVTKFVTNYLSQADRDTLAGYNGTDLPIQRLMAVKLTRIIQTNVVLFTTNDVQSESARNVSARTRELYARRAELNTNEISLLNRLLLEDAWFYLEPLSTHRYYWIHAISCGGPDAYSAWVAARPSDQATNPPPLSFSAQAFPYNSMALVQWNVPDTTDQTSGLDTTWQFSVERKEGTSGTYALISQTGFGLTYLDPDVVNDHSYMYRVTAFDPLYNRYQAETALVTPTNSAGLTLFDPAPGNSYVDLTWTPIRANQFNVKHSLNPNGPYEIVASINTQNAFHSAQNAYRHLNVQNGVTHYYQIQAFLPTGLEIDSDIKSATPLATLAPLPPDNFHGRFMPDSTNGQVVLSWNARSGAHTYQVFVCDQSRLTPLAGYNGVNTACTYKIPEGTVANTVFTFAVRSVNAQELAGDLVETTVTNLAQAVPPDAGTAPVVLQVAGSLVDLPVTAPTNLALNAQVNVPDVQQVNFYVDGQIIGTANSAPYQITWFHVPGGSHSVTATALVYDPSSTVFGTATTYNSSEIQVDVTVEPELAAYQTSASDLQLPAPALPIGLSRSYTSRSIGANGVLGVGWSASWSMGSVKLSTDLNSGWVGVVQTVLGTPQYYISESAAHYMTVTLPDGQSVQFAPQLNYYPGRHPEEYDSVSGDATLSMNYQPFTVNQGSLISDGVNDLTADNYSSATWNTAPVSFGSLGPSQFTYTSPDGTAYLFSQPGGDTLSWLLTRITDRNGNSLIYTYNNSDNTLQSISNSCGRSVRFSYSVPQTGTTNISVFDSLQPQGNAVIVYVTVNSQLTEVRRLVDRSAGTYETTRYAYGTAGADLNRLTDITDARGIRVLHNVYTNSNGDVMVQISPGRTNTFQFDSTTYNLTVTATSSTATNTVLMTSDASGAISGATQPVSGSTPANTLVTQCTYDDRGRLIAQTDANGHTKTYTYDDLDRLVGQSDENGNGTSVALNSFGQPNISTDARGKQTLYEYDNQGNPLNVRDPSGTATDYVYSDPVNSGGQVQLGKMLASQKQNVPFVPYTLVTEYTYNTNSPIKGDLTSESQKWMMDTNTIGNAVTTSYQYDANGNRTLEIKTRTVNGGTQYITNAYTYDAQNRVVMTVVSAGGAEILAPQTNSVAYNKLGKQSVSTDAAGRSTTNIYDFNGNLIETVYPDGMVSRTSYDGFGRQQYIQERAKRLRFTDNPTTAPATRNTYDASGRVIKVEKFDNVTLTEPQATAGTDFVGAPTETQYKIVATDPGSSALTTTRTFYDAVGRVQYSVSARGAVTEYRYDDAGRRTNVLVYTGYTFDPAQTGTNAPNPSGPSQSTSYTYDANGNQLTVTDAAGHTTTSIYDDANRVIEVRYPASNGTVSRFLYYDGLGRKIQENDEAGVATTYSYDFRGLLTSVTLAAGTAQAVTMVYQYDELGNLTTQTDAAGHGTTFRYDALGRRTGRTLPLNESEGFAYDVVGNVIYQTNFNGVVITNQYDVMNRLTSCSSVNGYAVSYVYRSPGLKATMTDASGVTSYSYDSLRRLQVKTVAWTNGPTASLNYLYDNTGSLTNLWSSTSNGVNLVYSYDLLGRLTNVLANGNAAADYGFDLVGNLQSIRYGNGVSNLYQYDSRNRLTSLVWKTNETAIASFAYQLGPTGNRTSLSETIIGTSQQYAWTYDLLYRLKQEVISGGTSGTLLYGYDAVGNRTNRQSSISQLTNCISSFNANDWLTADNYDNNGNTTGSSGNSYQYDALNHLTNVNNGAILMTYDGDGNRASKKLGATTTFYLVDDRNPSGYAQVLEEQKVSSTTTNLAFVYNYGLSLISHRRLANGLVRYYGLDGHGSARLLIDGPTATVTDVLTYDAYGNLIASITGTGIRPYLFCCEQWDQDLGMYYLRARYYAPGTGRFWTMDTYEGNNEDPLSLHKYLYCKANPANGKDPSGHDMAEMVVVTAIIFTLSTSTIEHARPQTTPSFWDQINGGSSGFEEYNQNMYFEYRWSGWLNRAKQFYTDKLGALVNSSLSANQSLKEIPWDNAPSSRIGVYPAGSNYGSGNDTKYGDAPESYWEKWSSLGAFTFEIQGPIRIDGNQWHADLIVGDVSLFNSDEPGHYIFGSHEKHFNRARWDLSAQIGQ